MGLPRRVLSEADGRCKLVHVARTRTKTPSPRPKADGFEPYENFWVNLRRLGQRLAALHHGADTGPHWPFEGPTPVAADERKALSDLAREHFARHDGAK